MQRHGFQVNFDDAGCRVFNRHGTGREDRAVRLPVGGHNLGCDLIPFLQPFRLEHRRGRAGGRDPVDDPLVPVGDSVAVRILALDVNTEFRIECHVCGIDPG